MKRFAKVALAGLAAYAALKLVGGVLLPLLGLAVGLVALVVKVAIVIGVGWLVLNLLGQWGEERA